MTSFKMVEDVSSRIGKALPFECDDRFKKV